MTKGCIYVQNIHLRINRANVVFQGFQGTKNLPTGKINIGIPYWNTHTQIRKEKKNHISNSLQILFQVPTTNFMFTIPAYSF